MCYIHINIYVILILILILILIYIYIYINIYIYSASERTFEVIRNHSQAQAHLWFQDRKQGSQ